MAFRREQGVVALGEAFTSVVGFLQFVALDHGAHRAIDDENAISRSFLQKGGTRFLRHFNASFHFKLVRP